MCVRACVCVCVEWGGEGWVGGGGNNYTFKEELPSESRTSVNQTLTFAK